MTDFMKLHRPGLGNAASYQVSGIPFLSGGIAVPISGSPPRQISFPSVTKKVTVLNIGNHPMKLGFSVNGALGNNYITLQKLGDPQDRIELEVKSTAIYVVCVGSATTIDVAAELTNIPATELPNNWSGSAGVG